MNREKKELSYNWYILLPLIALLAIVPLIVYLKVVPLDSALSNFWTGQSENADFFSYYKMVWIIICSISAAAVLILLAALNGSDTVLRATFYYIPILIYVFFVILSTEFSKYVDVSLKGFPDRYEGMYVLLAYMAILIVTINMASKEKYIKILLTALFAGGVVLGIIGIFQYMGYDILKTNLGKSLILPSRYASMAEQLNFQFEKNVIYATLYHLNYVGSYMAMLFPLSFTFFLLSKRRKVKILFALLTILMALNWLGCTSRAGIFGGIVAIIILMIMINKVVIKQWKFFLGGLALIVIIGVGLNYLSSGYLGSRISSLIVNAMEITKDPGADTKSNVLFQGLDIAGNRATLTTSTDKLTILMNDRQIAFQDENGKTIDMSMDEDLGKVTLADTRYGSYELYLGKINKMKVLTLDRENLSLKFKLSKDQIELLNSKAEVVKIEPVESWGFEGKELLGSSRGYIWSRSIPLLKNTKFIGFGPDTFAIYFPQNDIIGKFYAYAGDMWQIVDKPHNYYLQVALSTGIISLLALLSLFLAYIISSIRLYIRNDYSDYISKAGVGIFVAVCGYLAAGFFNDSVVSVAPVFWILLGLGISTNYIVKKEKVNPVK